MLAPGGTNIPQFIPTAVGPGKLSPLGCIEMGRGWVLSPRSFPRTSPCFALVTPPPKSLRALVHRHVHSGSIAPGWVGWDLG